MGLEVEESSISPLGAGTFIEAHRLVRAVLNGQDFPRLRVGTFIEACKRGWKQRTLNTAFLRLRAGIFVMVLNVNREVSRGLRSLVLETELVSRTRLFSLQHEDELDAVSTADSSCQLSESEMTKSDARNL